MDFYILNTDSLQHRDNFVCRLVEKAHKQDHQVYIHAETKQQAQDFDQLLWSFRDDSFLPHSLATAEEAIPTPIKIGYTEEYRKDFGTDILINLAAKIPAFMQQFLRVIEVVPNQQQFKNIAREHYRYYQNHNYQINTHKIN